MCIPNGVCDNVSKNKAYESVQITNEGDSGIFEVNCTKVKESKRDNIKPARPPINKCYAG